MWEMLFCSLHINTKYTISTESKEAFTQLSFMEGVSYRGNYTNRFLKNKFCQSYPKLISTGSCLYFSQVLCIMEFIQIAASTTHPEILWCIRQNPQQFSDHYIYQEGFLVSRKKKLNKCSHSKQTAKIEKEHSSHFLNHKNLTGISKPCSENTFRFLLIQISLSLNQKETTARTTARFDTIQIFLYYLFWYYVALLWEHLIQCIEGLLVSAIQAPHRLLR